MAFDVSQSPHCLCSLFSKAAMCRGPEELFELYGINGTVGATERQFKDSIAPALVGMLDSKVLPLWVLHSFVQHALML
jgi:hypothetical protein